MKRIVLYDDEIETVEEGYYIDWEYFKETMEEIIWRIIKAEPLADQKKDQI